MLGRPLPTHTIRSMRQKKVIINWCGCANVSGLYVTACRFQDPNFGALVLLVSCHSVYACMKSVLPSTYIRTSSLSVEPKLKKVLLPLPARVMFTRPQLPLAR